MPDKIIEILSEVEGIGPVEVLEIDPMRHVVNYRTVMPVPTNLPDGTNEIRVTGFSFCMN